MANCVHANQIGEVRLGQASPSVTLMNAENEIIIQGIKDGKQNENELTDLVFFTRHQERNGKRIQPHEKQLAQEWELLRAQLVRPILQSREVFLKATQLYDAEDYRNAVILFERVRHMPEITDEIRAFCLLNIGQIHLKLKNFFTAIIYYESYLATPFSEDNREGVQTLINRAKQGAGFPIRQVTTPTTK